MKKLLLLLAIIVLALSGCVIIRNHSGGEGLTEVYLLGKALINGPIVGGTVRVYDLDNHLLKEVSNETYTSGTFTLYFETVPSDFRVEITGGTHEGLPFTGHLYAEVRSLDPKLNSIIVSPISTLVSKYIQNKPGTNYAEVVNLLKSFLMIEEYARVIDFYEFHEDYFSTEEFENQMNENGGFDLFIDCLLADMENGVLHSFGSTVSNRSISSMILKLALKEIGDGLSTWAIGEGADWILSLITDDNSVDYEQDIKNMESKLNTIIQELEKLSKEVKEAEKRIVSEIRKNRWEADMTAIQDELSLIDTMYGRLDIIAQSDPDKVKKPAQELVESILDPNDGIEPAFRTINRSMIDLWDTDGLLKTWAGNVYEQYYAQYGEMSTEELYVDNVLPYYNKLASFYEYIAAYQIKAVNLLIEADHAKGQLYSEYFFNDIYLPAARGRQADIMRSASEYFISLVEFYTNWEPWITVDPNFQDVNFTRIIQDCTKIIGGLGYYNNMMSIHLMWLSNYNFEHSKEIRPYFNNIRDKGLTFDLNLGFVTLKASESTLNLSDNFYIFDDGGKLCFPLGYRDYVLTDVPTATYAHYNTNIYGPVIIPQEYLTGTEFGSAPISHDYETRPFFINIDQDINGDNQYQSWIVFLYAKNHFPIN
jgi:hypothetical protein